MQRIHMPDIEQTSLLPRPLMTFPHTQIRVLHRHREAPKRNHLPSIFNVQFVKRCLTEATIAF